MTTQWLPVNALSQKAIEHMTASFVSVFPHSLLSVWSNHELIPMGSRTPFDPALLEERLAASRRARADLASISVHKPVQILARIMRMDEELRRDLAEARVISNQAMIWRRSSPIHSIRPDQAAALTPRPPEQVVEVG